MAEARSSNRRKSISVSLCVPAFPFLTSHLRYADTDNPVIAAAPLIRASSASDRRKLMTLLTEDLRKKSPGSPQTRRFPLPLNVQRRRLHRLPADRRRQLGPGVGVDLRFVARAADRHVVKILPGRQASGIEVNHHPIGRKPLSAVHGCRIGVLKV